MAKTQFLCQIKGKWGKLKGHFKVDKLWNFIQLLHYSSAVLIYVKWKTYKPSLLSAFCSSAVWIYVKWKTYKPSVLSALCSSAVWIYVKWKTYKPSVLSALCSSAVWINVKWKTYKPSVLPAAAIEDVFFQKLVLDEENYINQFNSFHLSHSAG